MTWWLIEYELLKDILRPRPHLDPAAQSQIWLCMNLLTMSLQNGWRIAFRICLNRFCFNPFWIRLCPPYTSLLGLPSLLSVVSAPIPTHWFKQQLGGVAVTVGRKTMPVFQCGGIGGIDCNVSMPTLSEVLLNRTLNILLSQHGRDVSVNTVISYWPKAKTHNWGGQSIMKLYYSVLIYSS